MWDLKYHALLTRGDEDRNGATLVSHARRNVDILGLERPL